MMGTICERFCCKEFSNSFGFSKVVDTLQIPSNAYVTFSIQNNSKTFGNFRVSSESARYPSGIKFSFFRPF
ncbi:hypothetical protein TTRE_0000314401, partial [Trichuris trichiura]